MWEYEYSIETNAAREALWQHWSDMATWPQWNAGIETIDVEGPFAVGTAFTMTPPGDEPIRMRLVEIKPGEPFTDEMDAGDFVVRTVHAVAPNGTGGSTITYRTEFHGPAADQAGAEMGPAITADFPDVVAGLVAVAEKSATDE